MHTDSESHAGETCLLAFDMFPLIRSLALLRRLISTP